MPIHLNTDLKWVSYWTTQPALKAGKPQGANFPNHILPSNFSIQQPTRACDLTGPTRPWHYPLQLYTTLGVVDTFSILLKLIFYQVTYIATIFWRACGLSLGFPSGDITTSFPTQPWQLFNQLHTHLCRSVTTKLTGKHAQLFLRHQSTSRLTFNFCCAILALQGEVLYISRPPKSLGEDIQALQPASPPGIWILPLAN